MTADDTQPGQDLARFEQAQRETYDQALREIRAGRKHSHWMWYVFPQFAGLGQSATSRHYAIRSIDEARAYLAHPVLGPRLREIAGALLELQGNPSAREIFGSIDAMKLRSSMTLFARTAPEESVFRRVLDRYFDGAPDPKTDALLRRPY